MNKIIDKFLLTGDKFISKLHLRQPGFTYSACGPFTEHRQRIKKIRETGNLKRLCRSESHKACYLHNAAYSDSKDMAKGTISDKIRKDRHFQIDMNRNYDGYQRALASMVYKFFDKKTGLRVSVNEHLAEELHKPVIKKFKRRKVYARFKGNIWAANVAERESLSSKNKNFKYLLYVINVFTKYAWAKPLKDKKGRTVLTAFVLKW